MWIQHAQEWFLHAQCDFDTHECDYYTHECDLHTHELNFNSIRVTFKRTSLNDRKITKNTTSTSVTFTLMRVILTHYVYKHKPKLQAPACNPHACLISTLRGIVTVPYCVPVQHPFVKIQHAYMQACSKSII
jgi:hypothetical protein